MNLQKPIKLLKQEPLKNLNALFLFYSVNIIDYVATLSFFIDLVLAQMATEMENADVLEFFSIIRILRLGGVS